MKRTACTACGTVLGPANRFCSACGTAREPECTTCGAVLPADARFCSRCGAKREPDAPADDAADVPPFETRPPPPEPEVPPALRAKFESVKAELQGDRREVVILFGDLSGFTSLSETMDPEDVTLLMQRLLRDLADVVYEHEGYVDKFIGDAVMALFGAPLSHEDDPHRAVLTGLAMQEVVARHNRASETPLALRVGIHVGEVVAAHLGAGARMQYTVLGDAVNVASRLEGQAEPGGVLVSDALYRRVEERFEAQEVPTLTLKGRAEPVRGYRIGGIRSAPRSERDAETPFVGREGELSRLAEVLAAVRDGRPARILIEAEAGGGKTRLVEEAFARAGSAVGRVILRFTSVHLPGQGAPAIEAFRELVQESGDPVAAAAALLGPEAHRHRSGIQGLARSTDGGADPLEDSDPATARQNRWIALAALIRRSAQLRPLVLWVEDAHWVDEAAAEFLGFLLPALEHDPVGVLITGRPELSAEWIPREIRRLPLTPLDDEAARTLLGDIAMDIDPESRRDLIRRSQGNPLYLEELARSLQEGGSRSGVPGTVQGLIMSRIDRLPASLQALLQMASVLGTRFSLPLLRRMYTLESGRISFDSALRSLQGSFLAVEDPDAAVCAFRHALAQEVAYGGLLSGIRKVLHESAARLGEEEFADRREAEAAFFAHHFWEAGLPREAAPHLWIAGLAAAEAYELPVAERFLDRLAQIAEEDPGAPADEGRARFLVAYGNVLLHRGRLEDAERCCRELVRAGERAGRPEWSARGLEYTGRIAWYRGELAAAEERFDRALAVLPGDQPRIEADLHNALGIVHYYRGRPEEAFAHHSTALQIRERIGDRLGMAKSYSNIGNLFADFHDDLEAAERHYRRGLELAEAVGDRQMEYSTLFNIATTKQDRGEWEDAVEVYRRGERLLEEMGWGHARHQNLQRQAEVEIALGHIGRALRLLQECLSRGDAILEPANRVNSRVFLFDAYLRAGADELAEAALGDARRLVDELGVEEALETVLLREGRWHAARARWSEAAEAFAAAAEQARRQNHGAYAALADAHRLRARARAGVPEDGQRPLEHRGEAPQRAVVDFLLADAAAEREPSAAVAAELERVGDEAARLRDPALERAAVERAAEVWIVHGERARSRAALERAGRALAALREGLPDDLAEAFAVHPRNAALRAIPQGAPYS